ncbi:hypothetical protein P3T76_000065 [Phytophthora citrophthora]|uniref:Uncharacterized protein n=1 Tax=Phytophthora citrophthora TaxID=4793 RepID=A0AAD9H0L1_9STRA|nr:hypothetical protein P3T76_000065 [Phytophthora citrophthora]
MSALDIDWLRPVAPDGPTPLQTLVDWFAVNGVVYHASSHQREVLVPLCRDLNARGVQCEVDQILDYVSYLQEVVHDATALTHKLPTDLQPYRERLQTLLFKNGHNEGSTALPSPHKRSTNRLSWLEPSTYGGPSGMEVLVDWLKNNYATYARSSRKGEKGRMLEELVKDMKDAGIQDCAVNTVRAKIDVLHREVKGEKSRSAAWEQFGSVLEEIFTMGDAGQERDDNSDKEENGAAGGQNAGLDGSSIQTDALNVNSVGIVTTSKPSVKHTRSSPTSRLSWMKQVLPGSLTAMELLVGWMERHYYDYTHTRKKGDKGRMLIKLLRKIEAAGHQGCTIHAIRVKIDSLQRQAGGKARPSSAFDQFGTSLRRVFAEKQGLEPRISPRSADGEHSSDDSQGSDDEMESDGETVTDTVKSPEFEADSARILTTQVDTSRSLESREVGDVEMVEATTKLPVTSILDTSNPFVLEPASTLESAISLETSTTLEAGNSNENCISAASDSETEDEQDKRAKVKPIVAPTAQQPPSPIRSPSTNEIVRIATLLRERHDLLQRGVPEAQVDKFLPLPDL